MKKLMMIAALIAFSFAVMALRPLTVVAQSTYHSGFASDYENPSDEVCRQRFLSLFATHGHPADGKVWRFGSAYSYKLFTVLFNLYYGIPGEPSLTDNRIVEIIKGSAIVEIPDDYNQFASIQRYDASGKMDMYYPDETGKRWFSFEGKSWGVIHCGNGVNWFSKPTTVFVPQIQTIDRPVIKTVTRTVVEIDTFVKHDTIDRYVNNNVQTPPQYGPPPVDEELYIPQISVNGQIMFGIGLNQYGQQQYCRAQDWGNYCNQHGIQQRGNSYYCKPENPIRQQYARNNPPRQQNPPRNNGGGPAQGNNGGSQRPTQGNIPGTGGGGGRGTINGNGNVANQGNNGGSQRPTAGNIPGTGGAGGRGSVNASSFNSTNNTRSLYANTGNNNVAPNSNGWGNVRNNMQVQNNNMNMGNRMSGGNSGWGNRASGGSGGYGGGGRYGGGGGRMSRR